MNKTFQEKVEVWKPKIWKVIQSYLPETKDDFGQIVADYPSRQGRYIRPGLLLCSYEMLGGKESEVLLTAAALQTAGDWLLIHDDVQDQAVSRRGRPSLNKTYGDPIAINAGDSLHLIMWRMLYDNLNLVGPAVGLKIVNEVQNMLFQTTIGQFLELKMVQDKKFLTTEEEYFNMVDQKTVCYTIFAPMRLGAILARQTEAFPLIENFAQPWGRAFQIRNDLNNLAEFQSTKNSDIAEGKRNIPFLHLWQNSNKHEQAEIRRIYTKTPMEKSVNDIATILALMEKYRSIKYAEDLITKLTDQSRSAIQVFGTSTKTGPRVQTLIEALEYTTVLDSK